MVPENSPEPSECSENDKFNRKINVGENIHQRSTISKNDKFDIPHVIKYITFKEINGINKGYIVCEELLIA